MPKRFKCVLFDLDGTLVSTGGAGIRALDRAFFDLYGIRGAMENIQAAGKTDPAIVREIFQSKMGRACGAQEMSEVQDAYLSHVGEECRSAEDYRVMEGVPEVLESLKSFGVAVGLGTGNLEAGARKKLERGGLNSYFSFGGFGSDSEDRAELLKIGHGKACSLNCVEIPKENVFVVGDTALDISAAKRAGFPVIAMATGASSLKALSAHGPDYLLPNFVNREEFVKIILGE